MVPKIRGWNSHSKTMEYKEQHHPLFNIHFITYMSSVGLRDKNEKLIYEGDIVRFNGQIGIIVFECGAFGIAIDDDVDYDRIQEFMDKDEECCGSAFEGCFNDNFISLWEIYWNLCCIENYLYMVEVIGNIHEHPELLDETK